MSVLTMDTLLATLRGATDAQWLAFMQLQNERGIPLFHAAEEEKEAAAAAAEEAARAAAAEAENSRTFAAKVAARKMTAEAKAAAKAAKAEEKVAAKAAKAEAKTAAKGAKAEAKTAAKAAKAEAKVETKVAAKEPIAPAAAPAAVPDSSDYRIPVWDIKTSVCIGRSFKGGEDKRWKPIIYRESQCGGKLVEGSDICTKCACREQKAIAEPEKAAKIGWLGRITEEPYDWSHMLGTAWAEKKKPVFAAAADPDTVASEEETGSMSGP